VDVNDLDHQRVRVIIRVTPLEHKRNVEGRGEMSKDGRLGVDTTSSSATVLCASVNSGEACDYMLKYSAAETVVGAESHRSTYRFEKTFLHIYPAFRIKLRLQRLCGPSGF
jgi:hypothetical protein